MGLLRAYILLSAALLISQGLHAQNLVPNGSFEDYASCPGSYSRNPAEFRVDDWRSLTWGSPDYFNACSKGEAAVPYNWAGVSDAFEGYGFAGLYTYMAIKDYREYLHTKLTEPLIKDSVYHIEFRYKLSSYSKYCTDRIGLLLSDTLPTLHHDRPLRIAPSVTFVKDSALTLETGSWELAVAEYKAKGNEQFLTIGNFSDNTETGLYYIQFRSPQQPMLAESAYYYIDAVKVIPGFMQPAPEEAETPPIFTDDPELDKTYVLENIQFEFNSYSLLPQSYFDLERVVAYMKNHPDVSVELAGHTDSVGDDTYNMTLSADRARSAADYLVAQGIHRNRITTRGYGEERPLARDNNERAQELNRRVEIKFHR